jgi:hypothetical protein
MNEGRSEVETVSERVHGSERAGGRVVSNELYYELLKVRSESTV